MKPESKQDRQRVAITGLGAVTGWGWGVEPLWQALCAGQTGIGAFERFDATPHRTAVACQVPPRELVPAGRSARAGGKRWSLADQFAVAAAEEALAQAGTMPAESLCGVYFASSTGGMWEAERYYASLIGVSQEPLDLASLSSQEYNGPGDTVARSLETAPGQPITGPVESISAACASGGLAIGAALEALREGEVDLAITGGADSLCQLTYSGFNGLRAVDTRPCRPFRGDRDGMSLGEGAAVLVLESEDHARRRGARILGWVLGAGASCDAHHMTAPQASGEGPSLAIAAALEDAGVAADEVDFVNTHGTGTKQNDSAESRALERVFGPRAHQLPLTSTKGSVGHLLGCAGTVEAVATVRCLATGTVHPTPGGGEADPDLDVCLVLDRPLELPNARIALSTSLAFGGSNASLILAREEA